MYEFFVATIPRLGRYFAGSFPFLSLRGFDSCLSLIDYISYLCFRLYGNGLMEALKASKRGSLAGGKIDFLGSGIEWASKAHV